MLRPPALILIAAVLTGCATFPQLDAVITPEARRADYPALVPVDSIIVRRGDSTITAQTGERLRARAANLRARARLLRGASVDEETRLRLARRLQQLGG
jgi:type IV pilus biogenesis protein CpaD/CtpE